ncbi:hypothetical protein BC831DRAFT_36451 [Entophlyctis helioformis]|nr:hypothetical protein BC831DRAFT_36451 [Entophlyctis helioformis]
MTLPAAIGGNNQQAAVHAPGQPAADTPSQAAMDATNQAAADAPDQPGEDASDHRHMRVLLEDMLSGGPQSAPIFGVHAIRSSTSWTRRQLIEDIVARIQSFTVGMRHAGLVVIGAVVEELLELDQDAPLPPSYHVYKWPDGKATQYCFLDADLKDLMTWRQGHHQGPWRCHESGALVRSVHASRGHCRADHVRRESV